MKTSGDRRVFYSAFLGKRSVMEDDSTATMVVSTTCLEIGSNTVTHLQRIRRAGTV
jgi:hypothetical protein